MKDKIILFVIGVLVGAVIATGAFLVYSNFSCNNNNRDMQMRDGNPPSMPNGENDNNGQQRELPNDRQQSKGGRNAR